MINQLQHIAICGNIGSGKTTLAEKLAKHYGWTALLESVDHNPYLRDFYQDMSKWSFHLQIFFLNSRFKQVNQIRESKRTIIQDRTIYEDAYIFASNLRQNGLMTERDFATYKDLFESMQQFVKPPDLLIYLKADIPKLVQQIEKRGRDFEYAIRIDYLMSLNAHYEEWIGNYNLGKLVVIDVNKIDFVGNADDYSDVVGRIDLEINSLFG
jgi:deoxyadenosine/deoxycytidine kinase